MLLDRSRFTFVPMLESGWLAIRAELDALRDEDFFAWYDEGSYNHGWDVCGLFASVHEQRGRISTDVQRRCPRTMGSLDAIPGLQVATFSRLLPGCIIYPHADCDTGTVRCHLGLHAPAGARLLLGERMHVWREGSCLVFDNRGTHGACNESSAPRVVLLIDVQREVYGL